MMHKAVSSPILQLIRRTVEDRRVRELPDQELLRRFHAQQDEAAFHALLRRHGPMVLDVCHGVLSNEADAEDAFQATFLILAHKAGSIRKAASLGSWLHGVAYRTALKARAQAATRHKHETRTPERQAPESPGLSWQEVRQVLHEELHGMAECYRVPLVLCYLEGITQEAAAAQMGVAKSTLRERLERGRELLRGRLVRRGLGPAAVLVTVAWPGAAAALPAALMVSTNKAATAVVAGQTAAGLVSAKAVALTEGVVQTMVWTQWKIATAVLVTVGVFGSGVGMMGGVGAAPANGYAVITPIAMAAPQDTGEKKEAERRRDEREMMEARRRREAIEESSLRAAQERQKVMEQMLIQEIHKAIRASEDMYTANPNKAVKLLRDVVNQVWDNPDITDRLRQELLTKLVAVRHELTTGAGKRKEREKEKRVVLERERAKEDRVLLERELTTLMAQRNTRTAEMEKMRAELAVIQAKMAILQKRLEDLERAKE